MGPLPNRPSANRPPKKIGPRQIGPLKKSAISKSAPRVENKQDTQVPHIFIYRQTKHIHNISKEKAE